MRIYFLAAAVACWIILGGPGGMTAAADAPQKPGEKEKCPVCGMFVAKYPDWTAEIIFTGGSIAFFDGAKDLFKYYFGLDKYNPGKKVADIASIFVTEYYDMDWIDARSAFYVIGSDILGPMGRELIPLKTMADAKQFLTDHDGKQILTFDGITVKVIGNLD